MKKQILILMVALFAITSAFGQTVHPIDCLVAAESPLFPALGKNYTYTVSVPNATQFTGSPSLTYQWFVTKSKTFITSGNISAVKIPTGTGYDAVMASGTFDNATNTAATVDIKWKSTALTTVPYFLVVNVVGKNGVCDPRNMKIYKIVPANMFTLDIENVNVISSNAIVSTAVSQCYQDIQSITWVDTDAANAKYDYGTNTLVWAVAAANWATSWTPTIKLTAAVNANETVSLTWNTAIDGTGTSGTFTTTDGITWNTTAPVTTAVTGGFVGALGQVVYIRMELDHTTAATQWEGTSDIAVILAIDAVTANNDPDLHYTGTSAVCGVADGFTNDIAAVQTVKQRPSITTSPATVPFLIPIK